MRSAETAWRHAAYIRSAETAWWHAACGAVLKFEMIYNKKRLILYIVLAALMMILIFVHSAMSADISKAESGLFSEFFASIFQLESELASFVVRKSAHFLEYMLLGIFFALVAKELYLRRVAGAAFKTEVDFSTSAVPDANHEAPPASVFSGKWGSFLIWLFAWAGGILYAVTDEIHQIFVEGRSCELRDLLIDAAGVLLGVVIVMVVQKGKANRFRRSKFSHY